MKFRRFLLPLALATIAGAQVSSTISGTVTDPTGAVVSGVAVTAANTDTGAERSATTGPEGRYQFFSLPVGDYEIRASKAGFNEEVRTGVQLAVGQNATVDLSLKIGEASQHVTVSG